MGGVIEGTRGEPSGIPASGDDTARAGEPADGTDVDPFAVPVMEDGVERMPPRAVVAPPVPETTKDGCSGFEIARAAGLSVDGGAEVAGGAIAAVGTSINVAIVTTIRRMSDFRA